MILQIIICNSSQHREEKGVHLNSPDALELEGALLATKTRGEDTIFIHSPLHLDSIYCLNTNLLDRLFALAASQEAKIVITSPWLS